MLLRVTKSDRNDDPDKQFSHQISALFSPYTQPANGPACSHQTHCCWMAENMYTVTPNQAQNTVWQFLYL